ncbi:cytochrome P450 [Acaryochloris marina NIES-2412]|uniref:cytochrome P450 n=1 Tax=Acaryochloris marina TaxID=155978 RepID=UPI004059417F
MQAIPTPKTPKFWQATQWVLDPLGYMNTNFSRFGDMFKAQVPSGSDEPWVLINNPKVLQYILTHDTGKEFTAPGEVNSLLAQVMGWQNLILLSGKQHQHRRRLVMPPFHGERLNVYGQVIRQITLDLLQQWPIDTTLDMRELMQKITMRVILQVVFGMHEGERYLQIEHLLHSRLSITASPITSAIIFLPWLQQDFGSWSPGHRFLEFAAQTDQLLFTEIQERRANLDSDRPDILSLLLAATDEEGKGLTDQDLRDELMALLAAGHDTTATALAWAIYWIHALPEVKEKLMAELDTMTNPQDPAEFLRLPYLAAVCNETLRIHPIAMVTFPRRVKVPLKLGGYTLEPGTLVVGSIHSLHQREDLFPNPKQFCPERFLQNQFSPYEYMPFGGGVRRCVGAALAQYELKIILGTMLTQFSFDLLNRKMVQPGRRGITSGPITPILIQKQGAQSQPKKPLQTV